MIAVLVFFVSTPFFAQEEEDLKAKEKSLRNSKNYTWEGNKKLSEDNFIAAEADYRVAISKSPENVAAPFNLGNAYYNNETYSEAFGRFKEAGESATAKTEKHNAYHNMGNVFMKRKDYAKAVEAYKEALRNDSTDEETRYNLALAKELLKKDEENKNQNEDNKDDQKDQDKEDDKEDKDKEGDNEDEKDQDKQDEGDKGDEGDEDDKGDKNEDENKEGDGDDKKEQNKKPEQGDNEKDQPAPRPNQLSKQQVENLLRAMQNAEKQVQEKIDAKKVQGAKVKTEKDW